MAAAWAAPLMGGEGFESPPPKRAFLGGGSNFFKSRSFFSSIDPKFFVSLLESKTGLHNHFGDSGDLFADPVGFRKKSCPTFLLFLGHF